MTKTDTFFHYSAVDPAKLSLLSDKELLLLAEKIGIFVPEGLDRVFIIEEIIEALEEDTSERVFSHDAPGHVEEKKLSGTGYIPGRLEEIDIPDYYNETYIRLIVRDPLWIFAYWDISQSQREKLLSEDEELKLFLRVSEAEGPGQHSESSKAFHYHIPITFEDSKWYINVPEPNRWYSVDLCAGLLQKTKVIARSNTVRVPLQYISQTLKLPQITKSLLILSGSEELHLMEPQKENSMRILDIHGE